MQAQFLTGSIPRQLRDVSLPMVWGILATSLFNVINTYFIAQLGTNELVAIGFTVPVTMTVMAVLVGVNIGVLSMMSRSIGRGDRDLIRHMTMDSLTFVLLFIGCIALCGWLFIDPVFRALGASDEVLPYITDYMQIWYPGLVVLSLPLAANAVIRAAGDTRFSARIMIIAAVLNVALDPILIFGWFGFPAMGISGSALATVISYMLTFVLVMMHLYAKMHMLTLSLFTKSTLRSWKTIAYVGVPAAVSNMIAPLMVAFTTWMVASYGEHVVASLGIATRIEYLAMVVIYALSTGTSIMVGQNKGAGQLLRVQAVVRTSFSFCLIWGVLVTVFFIGGAELVPSWFHDDNRVIHYAALYLGIVPISIGLYGVAIVSNAAFNALGRPLPVVMITLSRAGLLYAPLAWYLQRSMGVEGVFVALALANVGSAVIAYGLMKRERTVNRSLLVAEV